MRPGWTARPPATLLRPAGLLVRDLLARSAGIPFAPDAYHNAWS